MKNINKKGMALYLVLATLLIVVIFANIVLSIISNQSRLTHHKVSRIQAYYAAQAGINAALEGLKLNDPFWLPVTPNPTRTITICHTNTTCDLGDPDLPTSINSVNVTVGPQDATSGIWSVSATVDYASN